MTTINAQMQQRRDTAADWTSGNPTLLAGEIGIETDTGKFKFGDGTTSWNSLTYVSTGSGGASEDILIVDSKPYTSTGGTFPSGSWQTRDLTGVVIDTGGNVASLSSNQIALVNGVYRIVHISAPAYMVNRHITQFVSVSGTPQITIPGSGEFSYSGDSIQTRSFVSNEVFTCAGHVFELQHRCETTKTSTGLGYGTGGMTGIDCIFSIVHLEKIG